MNESPNRILQCDNATCRDELNTLYQVGQNGAMLCYACVPPEMKKDLLNLMRYAYTGVAGIKAARVRAAEEIQQQSQTGRGDQSDTTSNALS